jgi:hypothetical protein
MTNLIELKSHYLTLPKKDLLIGLKVYDKANDEFIYIKDVENGIFAGINNADDFGHYYNMTNLLVENNLI